MNTDRHQTARQHGSPVVVDMHARELRLTDFKSVYAQAFVACLELEERVLQSLTQMRDLQRALVLQTNAASQGLLTNSKALAEQHAGVAAEITRASSVLSTVTNDISTMRVNMLGADGIIGKTHQALLGEFDADGTLVTVGVVQDVNVALVTGKNGVAARMDARLTKVTEKLDSSLNGAEGAAARFEGRIKKSTSHAQETLQRMTVTLEQVNAIQKNWMLLAVTGAGLLSIGMLAGVLLSRIFMQS